MSSIKSFSSKGNSKNRIAKKSKRVYPIPRFPTPAHFIPGSPQNLDWLEHDPAKIRFFNEGLQKMNEISDRYDKMYGYK